MGGMGSRFGGPLPKQFCKLADGRRIFEATADMLLNHLNINTCVLSASLEWLNKPEMEDSIKILKRKYSGVDFIACEGGKTRHQTFRNAFQAVPVFDENSVVLSQDANRPFISDKFAETLKRQIIQLDETVPCAIPVIPVTNSIVSIENGLVTEYQKREEMRQVQTPQLLIAGCALTAITTIDENRDFPDEGSMMIEAGYYVKIFEGDVNNIKITYSEDLT